MENKVTCRYCGIAFVPRQGKPGRIDECEPCLHETAPKPRIVNYKREEFKKKLRRLDWYKKMSDEEFDKGFDEMVRIMKLRF